MLKKNPVETYRGLQGDKIDHVNLVDWVQTELEVEYLCQLLYFYYILHGFFEKTLRYLRTARTFTVQLETTHGFDFKTPNFPIHVIYTRYCIEKENLYTQKHYVCAILDELR